MKRRIKWSEGDSCPAYNNVVTSTLEYGGYGTYVVTTGFPVSAAMAGFSKNYIDRFEDGYLGHYEADDYDFSPKVYVTSISYYGFTVGYENITGSLEFNYFAM